MQTIAELMKQKYNPHTPMKEVPLAVEECLNFIFSSLKLFFKSK